MSSQTVVYFSHVFSTICHWKHHILLWGWCVYCDALWLVFSNHCLLHIGNRMFFLTVWSTGVKLQSSRASILQLLDVALLQWINELGYKWDTGELVCISRGGNSVIWLRFIGAGTRHPMGKPSPSICLLCSVPLHVVNLTLDFLWCSFSNGFSFFFLDYTTNSFPFYSLFYQKCRSLQLIQSYHFIHVFLTS